MLRTNAHLSDDEAVAKMGHPVLVVRMTMRIRAYVLAGGRSSRMGSDKAMLVLAGRTLLGRVVDCLRQVELLKDGDGRVVVTVAGEREELEGADRAVVDRYEARGPMGGMEAALRDLHETDAAEWAFFIPVDMPFVPPGVIDALLRLWIDAVKDGAVVCHIVVDGRRHPLVSLVHRSLHSYFVKALEAGQYKVLPVIESASAALALARDADVCKGVFRTSVSGGEAALVVAGEMVTRAEECARRLWFSNLNSQEDFHEAETFLARLGFTLELPTT